MRLTWFKPQPIRDVVRDMIYEAELLQLQHQAAGEHYLALADMYRARIRYLRAQMTQENADNPHVFDELAKAAVYRCKA